MLFLICCSSFFFFYSCYFQGQVFGFFISVAYLWVGGKNLVDLFPTDLSSGADKNEADDDDDKISNNDTSVHLGSAFASVCLAGLMYVRRVGIGPNFFGME